MNTTAEYQARLNRVMDYIAAHLDEPLKLEKLAEVACFSPYHFHRIFRAMSGETLNAYIQRLRLERAANQLIYDQNASITAIALNCGFSGSPAFARAFRDFYGMSASQWREDGHAKFSKNCKMPHKNRQAVSIETTYPPGKYPIWRIAMTCKLETKVEIKELPALEVAYVRHIGPYQGDAQVFNDLWAKLMVWAGPRGLINFPQTQALSIYNDNERLTEDAKLQVCVAITVPADTKAEGEIGCMLIPGGKCAVAAFELTESQYGEAWDMLMGEWLPASGFQPDERPCLEFYLNDPKTHPEGKHLVEIVVPVKPR